ncbi:MAG: protoheme IX farnesyltransferase [Planctomycetota bacterium]
MDSSSSLTTRVPETSFSAVAHPKTGRERGAGFDRGARLERHAGLERGSSVDRNVPIDLDRSVPLALDRSVPLERTAHLERIAIPSKWADYRELTKPRIVTMILVTTMATAILGGSAAGGALLDWDAWLLLLFATGSVAASAGAANQVWERVIDRQMARTQNRPMADGRLSVPAALIFTAALLLGGSLVLAWAFGPVPAGVAVATWLSYVVVYTPLKTRTAWNTTVGAVAGALPVLIGYTAAGGTLGDPLGWLVFGVLAAWQYPHFMAIAWLYRRQYGEAGFRMTTTIHPGGLDAAIQSIAGSVALWAMAVGAAFCVGSGSFAVFASVLISFSVAPMLVASLRFFRHRDDAAARKMLRSSLLVLPAVLLVLTLGVCWPAT